MSAQGNETGYRDLMRRAALKLQDAQSKLDAFEREKHEPIAIVGMGCRFPAGASDPEGYWSMLCHGVDAITPIPSDRWDADELYHPDPDQLGKSYSRHGGFLQGIDQFAPRFFGISQREAARMDPQHRILLEVAWETIERAGYCPTSLSGTRTSVFVGMMGQDYTQIVTQSLDIIDAHTGAGNGAAVAAGRLSFTFGFEGPSVTIDTACSSSLVAVHLALRSLRSGETDFALAGGVNLILSPIATLIECRTHMLSPDGRCKTFDARANGIVRGEGCGLVLLRRLSDALRDKDPIVAVLRGTAVNQDGRTSGLTVPNGLAQQRVIREALRDGQVQAKQVEYVEAHGTGTSLGDPIELEALSAVYGGREARERPLVVGSVKTNMGHLEGASGIAGLIKAALCLANESIPRNLHFATPNPHLDWDRLFIEVPTAQRSWLKREGTSFAAVSAFGFSGTNAHVILESAPRPPVVEPQRERTSHLLALSGQTNAELRELAGSMADALSAPGAGALADICYTINIGRTSFNERVAFVEPTAEKMAAALRAYSSGEPATPISWVSGRRESEEPRVAFLFTGQGSQYVGMARELFDTEPGFRKDLLRYEEILRPHLERSLTAVLFDEPSGAEGGVRGGALHETAYTQPATVALELALARLLRSWGLRPDVVLGHSVGEYAAALFADVFTPEEGLPLVAERARLMQRLSARGAMLAVFANEDLVSRAIEGHELVTLAALNGPKNSVISGEEATIDALARALAAGGIESRRLNVSHAFHSPLMRPMLADFERALGRIHLRAPSIDFISNLDGKEVGDAMAQPDYWLRHIFQPVRFAEGIRTVIGRGVRTFVEVGPKPTLLNLARDVVAPETALWLGTLHPRQANWSSLLGTMAELYVRGVKLDFRRFDGSSIRRKLVLPTYPFNRRRCWMNAASPWTRPGRHAGAPPSLLGTRLDSAALPQGTTVFSSEISAAAFSFVSDHRVYGNPVVPAAAFLEMVVAAATRLFDSTAFTLKDVSILQSLVLPAQEVRLVQTILEYGGDSATCTVVSKGDDSPDDRVGGRAAWVIHLTCRVSPLETQGEPPADLATWQQRCATLVDIGHLYAVIREHGLDYGPVMMGISSLRRGDNAALSFCERTDLSVGHMEDSSVSQFKEPSADYCVHPALFDSCLQTGAAVLPIDRHSTMYLPVGIARIDILGKLPGRVWTHATQRPSENPSDPPLTDLTLCTEKGEVVAKVEGLAVRKADRSVMMRGLDGDSADWLYRVGWKAHPAEEPPPAKRRWLIFTDNGGFGDAVAGLLSQGQARCIQVRRGSAYERSSDGVRLDPRSREQFDRLLSEESVEPPDGVLYLWGLDDGFDAQASLSNLALAEELGCVGALHLVQAIGRGSWTEQPRLVLVTRGSQHIHLEATHPRVAQAPLWGFGQAVATERPELRCLRIDLDAKPRADDLRAVLRALSLPERETQVAVRGDALYTARLERARLRGSANQQRVAVSPDASYLIAGGLGGLGLRLAHWLAGQGAVHIFLLGRSEPGADAQRLLDDLGARGVRARFLRADIASRDDLAAALDEIHRTGPPLRGVIHSAGVVRDAMIENQDMASFRAVLAPKVEGAWNLHELTHGITLDFFVLFSSASSLIGTPGQSNYVAANAFLDALAHLRRAEGKPGTSINWGSWAEVGMASELARTAGARPAAMGFGSIQVEQGLRVLDGILSGAVAQIGAFPIDWARLAEQLPSLSSQAFVEAFVGQMSSLEGSSSFREQMKDAAPNRRMSLLRAHVTSQVAAVLGLFETDKIAGEERLFDLGVDSLLAVEIKNRLSHSLGKDLRSTLVFDFPTVNGLVEHLAQQMGFAGAEESATETNQSDVERDAAITEIQGLSEDELTSLIDQELENVLTR